jgi:ArsR family transcriptional regulator, arsenate/arsenite/antimonite-responsive transcriptional repressor
MSCPIVAADIDICQYKGVTLPVLQPDALACCEPLACAPLSAEGAMKLAGVFKALADPARLRLLSLVLAHEGGEACVCDLIEPLGLSQPTVSHHLKVLHDAGLLERDKRGVWVYYRARPAALQALVDLLAVPGSAPIPA